MSDTQAGSAMDQYAKLVKPYTASDPLLSKDASDAVKFDCLRTLRPRVVWIGDYASDLWLYLRNNHIVLGIFLKDKHHPLGRLSRLAVLYCSACASFAISAIIDSPNVSDSTTVALGFSVVFYVYFIRVLGTWGKGRMFRRVRGMSGCCRCCGRLGLLAGMCCSTILFLIGLLVVTLVRLARPAASPTVAPTTAPVVIMQDYVVLPGPRLMQMTVPPSSQVPVPTISPPREPRSDQDDIVISFFLSQIASWFQAAVLLAILFTVLRFMEQKEVSRLKFGDDLEAVEAFWLSRNKALTERLNRARETERIPADVVIPVQHGEVVAVANGQLVRVITVQVGEEAGAAEGPLETTMDLPPPAYESEKSEEGVPDSIGDHSEAPIPSAPSFHETSDMEK